MTEYEVQTIKDAIKRYVNAAMQHKALRDRPERYDGITRLAIEAKAVADIYAFAEIVTKYRYRQVDGLRSGVCEDCYIVHEDYVQHFKNGLYNHHTNQWHGDLVNIPEHAVIPIIFSQEIE